MNGRRGKPGLYKRFHQVEGLAHRVMQINIIRTFSTTIFVLIYDKIFMNNFRR
jgi:hypothetical protein